MCGSATVLSAAVWMAIAQTPVRAGDGPAVTQESSNAAEAAIREILRDQQASWNRGDIDRFMRHYWKSEQLTFSSGGTTTRGWKNTLANYRRRYPTVERMGKVHFADLEIFPLGGEAALVLGKWQLKRQTDPVGGNFSIVFQRIGGRWVIIHDHTSRVPETVGTPSQANARAEDD